MVIISISFGEFAMTVIWILVILGTCIICRSLSSTQEPTTSSESDPYPSNFQQTDRSPKPAAYVFTDCKERRSRWTKRADACRSAVPYETRYEYVNTGYRGDESVYPSQMQSEWPGRVPGRVSARVYHKESYQPTLDFAGMRSNQAGNTYVDRLIQAPNSGHEELIKVPYSHVMNFKGERMKVFVDCIFRVTTNFKHGSCSVVVALEDVNFGIEKACLKHAVEEGKCDSRCNPLFINKIEFHGTPENAGNCDDLILIVEPVDPAASFASNRYRQLNVALGISPHPWLNTPLGFQVGQSLTRQVPAFHLRGTKDNTEASWIWTLGRFDNGKKMNFRPVNLGRSPKLAIYPNHMPLRSKDEYTSLAKATWMTIGERQWNFNIKVRVHVAALKSHFLTYSLKKHTTLKLVPERRKTFRLGEQPTTDKDPYSRDFAARVRAAASDQSYQR